jgi:glutaredoxin
MARQTESVPPAIPPPPPPVTGRTEHRITLLGKPGCHLCDDARSVVSRVAEDLRVSWEERSILDDPRLLEEYGEQIPVVLIDGRQHTFWRVDEQRLRAALSPS